MEKAKKLIPYSVHLTPAIYKKLKEKAKSRQASSMVRDAITMIIEGQEEFNSGYNTALKDVLNIIKSHEYATIVDINHVNIGQSLEDEILMLRK